MDWRRSPRESMVAPSASYGSETLKLPSASSSSLPALDEHLVRPGTREEMVRGEKMLAQPALPPHGDQHFSLDYVLGAHIKPQYIGSTDLLTRAAHASDFATDTCIRRRGDDPATGRRHLEEIAFEIVYTQTLKSVSERAQDLTARGVRRVFAIFVKAGRISEWSREENKWRPLDPKGSIVDACLTHPLPLMALLDAANADDGVARALEAKGTRAIAAMKAESERLGAVREASSAVLAALKARGLRVPKKVRETIEDSTDLDVLRRWLLRAVTAESARDVIDDRR